MAYLKHLRTGVVRHKSDWAVIAVRNHMNKFESDPEIRREFCHLKRYLWWARAQGLFYQELVKCDKWGNE